MPDIISHHLIFVSHPPTLQNRIRFLFVPAVIETMQPPDHDLLLSNPYPSHPTLLSSNCFYLFL